MTWSYRGSWSAKAQIVAGAGNKYARVHLQDAAQVGWARASEVWWGAAFYLPVGFNAAVQGQVDLLRWDNFVQDPTTTQRCGIVIGSDKLIRLVRIRETIEQVTLVNSGVQLTEGVWHWLECHQVLYELFGGATNELYIDGVLKGSSIDANTYTADISVSRLRAGIVAINAGVQDQALELYVDRVLTRATGPNHGYTDPRRVKSGGAFVQKPTKVKRGGVFVP